MQYFFVLKDSVYKLVIIIISPEKPGTTKLFCNASHWPRMGGGVVLVTRYFEIIFVVSIYVR